MSAARLDGIASWYEVDADDRLQAVSPDWDVFARANEGPAALSRQVLGRPLQEFLTGDPTRMFIGAIFAATRLTGQPRTLPYRCDAPDLVRLLEMSVLPLPAGALRIEHRVRSVTPRQRRLSLQALRPHDPATARWLRCSQCLRLAMPAPGSPWTEVDQALPDLASTGNLTLPVRDGICPTCSARRPES
jgi:hypothetical protein